MFDKFLVEYKYLLVILLSVILGFLIGLERKTRAKEAGVRTHTIVCFGACLLMIISKYDFSGESADDARVAAQIVSGIGFIGAGMIVYRKNAVHGLTTAAGVLATAGIGMACGAGLYFVAVGGTAIMILVQCVLHINCNSYTEIEELTPEILNNFIDRIYIGEKYYDGSAHKQEIRIIYKFIGAESTHGYKVKGSRVAEIF